MIIYASKLLLSRKCDSTEIRRPIADWLHRKLRKPVTATSLAESDFVLSAGSAKVVSATAVEGPAELFAARLSHPDQAVKGRRWITEIGLQRTKKAWVCSVLLRTEESSALVASDVKVTRPLLVQHLFEQCRPLSETLGGKPRPLSIEDAEFLASELNDSDRTHPVVIVSPHYDGSYSLDTDHLGSQLIGVAPVAVIPQGTDTFALSDALTERFSCYAGAVNIIWPAITTPTGRFVPNTRLMAHDLAEMAASGRSVEKEILAIVTDRTNEPLSRDHLTVEAVKAAQHRTALEQLKSRKGDEAELAELYRQVDEDQRQRITHLESQLQSRDETVAGLKAEVYDLQVKNQAIKQSLDARTSPAPKQSTNILDLTERAILGRLMVEDALAVIEARYGDRLIILDSARKSAHDAEKFENPAKVFELLQKLCTDYWKALCDGKGDAQAREALGSAFAAGESETVENNKKAQALRTFVYKGRPIVMMKHLKIGYKRSDAQTWRAHFEWDPEERKIVIGHCGKHLDHG